jgi:ADP-ribosyl-[dinitrogen reductase] hydrolase
MNRQPTLFNEDRDDELPAQAWPSSQVSQTTQEQNSSSASTSNDSLKINEQLFRSWTNGKRIPLRRGAVFDQLPVSLPLDSLLDDRRIAGMLWGVAVGDSLGHSTEWKSDPSKRHQDFGTIVDHLCDPEVRSGRISDDTQFTFWMIQKLLDDGGLNFDSMTRQMVEQRHRIVGAGRNTVAALEQHHRRLANYKDATAGVIIGDPIACLGDLKTEGRGNGGLMRFSSMVIPYLMEPSPNFWRDSVLGCLITHGNAFALSSIVAMTNILWHLLSVPRGQPPQGEWYFDRYLQIASDLEVDRIPDPYCNEPVPKWYQSFRGTFCDFLDGPVRRAFRRGVNLRDACSLDGFGSRADILQTVPAVLYLLASHADSFESSIITAVNDTKDNDTIAAIVGAMVGAVHGQSMIRGRWIEGIRSQSLDGMSDDRSIIQSTIDRVETKVRVKNDTR